MVIRKKLALGFCFTSDYNTNPQNTALATRSTGVPIMLEGCSPQFQTQTSVPRLPKVPICRRGKV